MYGTCTLLLLLIASLQFSDAVLTHAAGGSFPHGSGSGAAGVAGSHKRPSANVTAAAAAAAPATNPNLKYFSVWDLESAKVSDYPSLAQWNNFVFTSSNLTQLSMFHQAGIRSSLLHVRSVFFDDQIERLRPDYASRWAALVPQVRPLLASGVLMGFFLGDELCWACIPYRDVITAADTVRASFPRGQAIIYYNEAFPVFTSDVCNNGTLLNYTQVPASLDWLSIDLYPDEGTLNGTITIYETLIYPKMADSQSVLFVPPAYGFDNYTVDQRNRMCCGPGNPPCNGNCTLAMLQWAADTYAWALRDTRMVGLNPWHYDTYQPGGYFNPGLVDMPAVLQAYVKIGAEIIQGTRRPLSVADLIS